MHFQKRSFFHLNPIRIFQKWSFFYLHPIRIFQYGHSFIYTLFDSFKNGHSFIYTLLESYILCYFPNFYSFMYFLWICDIINHLYVVSVRIMLDMFFTLLKHAYFLIYFRCFWNNVCWFFCIVSMRCYSLVWHLARKQCVVYVYKCVLCKFATLRINLQVKQMEGSKYESANFSFGFSMHDVP